MLSYPWKVALLTGPAACLVLMDITGAAIAGGRISGPFGSTEAQGTLVSYLYYTGILLTNAAESYLAIRFGTRRVWLAGQAGFITASLLTGLAWGMAPFLAGRLLMGMAAGLLQPVSLQLAFKTTAPTARLALVAVLTLTFAGPFLGLPLGGILSQAVDWRWVFLLNVPLGALWLLLGLACLEEAPIDPGLRFDWVGWLLLALLYVSVALGVAGVADSGWRWILGSFERRMLAGAALLLPLLIWWELRTRQPLLDLRLFALPRFWRGALVAWVGLIQIGAVVDLWLNFFLNPLLYGLGQQSTGEIMTWAVVGFFLAFPPAVIVLVRFGLPPVLICGFLLLLYTWWTLGVLDANVARGTLHVTLFLQGMGVALTLVPGLLGLALGIPRARLTQGVGLLTFVIRLIPPANIAILLTVLSLRTDVHFAQLVMELPSSDLAGPAAAAKSALLTVLVQRSAYMLGLEDASRFMQLVCVIGVLLCLTLPRGPLLPATAAASARPAAKATA